MTRAPFPFRSVAALILLAIVTVVCVSLGRWQLGRAEEREAIHANILSGRERAAVNITADTNPDDLLNWRQAHASGHWMNRYTVLIANRNLNGRPGYWVATPLALTGQNSVNAPEPNHQTPSFPATGHKAILVLRGWIPRPLGPDATLPPFDGPQTQVRVEGELREHVPRLFDLGALSGTAAQGLPDNPSKAVKPLEVQNLDLENFTAVTGIKLLPAVLQQTSAATLNDGTPLVQSWPTPSLDSDKNRGYALQWFAFAAIAAGAWLVIAWRTWRRRPQHST